MSDDVLKMKALIPLIEVLKNIDVFHFAHVIYLKGNGPWGSSDPCAVADPDESEDPGDIPPKLAKDNGLRYILEVQDVKSIRDNAIQQVGGVSDKQLLDAFHFYVENDAYLELT